MKSMWISLAFLRLLSASTPSGAESSNGRPVPKSLFCRHARSHQSVASLTHLHH